MLPLWLWQQLRGVLRLRGLPEEPRAAVVRGGAYTYDGPSPDEGPLEAGLRNAYDSLAYVCLIFEAMAE